MLNKIDFTEVVKKGNTPRYITPRHSGELIKYSQAIFKGMLAMYNEIGSSQKYPKLYDLRNLDYWNSLKVWRATAKILIDLTTLLMVKK